MNFLILLFLCSALGSHLQGKIPELEKSISLIHYLKSHDDSEPLVTRYSLADAIFAKAELDTAEPKVNLWLGANVMLEYTYDEAIALLDDKLSLAKKELNEVSLDLEFTRNQIITSEVCISRVYNWDVRRKRMLLQPS
jgi:prefoldin subunit 5